MTGFPPFCCGRRVGFVGVGGGLDDLTVCDAFDGVAGVSTSNLGTAGRDGEVLAAGLDGSFGAAVLVLVLARVGVRAAFEADGAHFAAPEPLPFLPQNLRSSLMCFSSKATRAFSTRASNSARFFAISRWNLFESS
jgi:hypothetical protein